MRVFEYEGDGWIFRNLYGTYGNNITQKDMHIRKCGSDALDFVFIEDGSEDEEFMHLSPPAIMDLIEILVECLGGLDFENGERDESR